MAAANRWARRKLAQNTWPYSTPKYIYYIQNIYTSSVKYSAVMTLLYRFDPIRSCYLLLKIHPDFLPDNCWEM